MNETGQWDLAKMRHKEGDKNNAVGKALKCGDDIGIEDVNRQNN